MNIRELRKSKGYTQEELAKIMGVDRSTIINWEKEKTSPSQFELDALRKIQQKESRNVPHETKMKIVNGDEKLIPFYDTIAVGGFALEADQSPMMEPTEMINPGTFLRRATGSLRVYGDSMFPKYTAGNIVAFREADKELIIFGEDYVLELSDRRILKKLVKSDIEGCVCAFSYNKELYKPQDIPINKIKRLFMVLGKIHLESSI